MKKSNNTGPASLLGGHSGSREPGRVRREPAVDLRPVVTELKRSTTRIITELRPAPVKFGTKVGRAIVVALSVVASVASVAGLYFVGFQISQSNVQIQQGNESLKGPSLSVAFPTSVQTGFHVKDRKVKNDWSSFMFVVTNTGRMPVTIVDLSEGDHADHRIQAVWMRLTEVNDVNAPSHQNEPLLLAPGEGALVRACNAGNVVHYPSFVLGDGRMVLPDLPSADPEVTPMSINDGFRKMKNCDVFYPGPSSPASSVPGP